VQIEPPAGMAKAAPSGLTPAEESRV